MLSRTAARGYCSLKQLFMFKAAQIHMKNRSDNGVSIGPLKRSPQTYCINIYLIQILFFISCTSITIVDAYSCLNVASVVLGGLSGAILTEISRLTAEDCYILDRQLELCGPNTAVGALVKSVLKHLKPIDVFQNPPDTVD